MKRTIRVYIRPVYYLYLAALLLLLPFPWLIAILLAEAIHEIGHLIAIMFLKIPINSIHLEPVGAKIFCPPMTNKQEFLTAIAGPLAGAFLIFLFPLFPHLSICALVQTAFNLIPVIPFDGGRILSSVLNIIIGQESAKRFCNTTATAVKVLLLFMSITVFRFSRFISFACLFAGISIIKKA